MANTPNLNLENINILADTEYVYNQIVTEIINKTNNNTIKIDNHNTMLLHKQAIGIVQTGLRANAEGDTTTASGASSHSEGYLSNASGNYSHAEGVNTESSGLQSHSEGYHTIASGSSSHAEGMGTSAIGHMSHSQNRYTKAQGYAQTTIGVYNILQGNSTSFVSTDNAFIIGNGSSEGTRSNAFRITFTGATYGLSAFNSTGADYAEFFEWADGNIYTEDRVGYFVTLDGDKIRKALSVDDYILGIVSANPSVVGNSYNDDWNGKYIKDYWGRIQYHDVIIPAIFDEKGNIIEEETTECQPIYNPNWSSSQEYIPREKRKEWSTIGMMGKLLVRDDGTCQVNSYCKSNNDGIATASTIGYRVIKRICDNIIEVLIK